MGGNYSKSIEPDQDSARYQLPGTSYRHRIPATGTRDLHLAFPVTGNRYPKTQLLTITAPVSIEVNYGNNHHAAFGRGKDDAHILSVACGTFQRIFGIGPARRFAFAIIDTAFGQNILYLGFVNMPAVHAATGMFGINKLTGVPVNNIVAGASIIPGGSSPGAVIAYRLIGVRLVIAVTAIGMFAMVLFIMFLPALLPAGITLTGG